MIKQLLGFEWITRLGGYSKLIVGFSGGLDSTVLLHALASFSSLRNKLIAVHINHGISPNSSSWQMHCEQCCLDLGIQFSAQSVQFDRDANVEEGARRARYAVFSSMLTGNDCLVLAHHLNDQAETLLLQLFRGAGVDGMAAMMEWGPLGVEGTMARPLLSCTRVELEQYAAVHQLTWIDDESNQDVNYSRNYLRHEVMPLLVKQWPGVARTLARTAIHCQQAKSNLDDLALIDCPELISPQLSLFIEPLKTLSAERLINVLRVWLKKNQIQLPSSKTFQRLIHEVILANSDAMPVVTWNDVRVARYRQHIYLEQQELLNRPDCIDWAEYPSPLVIEKYLTLSVKTAKQGLLIPKDARIQVRFRQGGEAFCWHGQTKQLKKLFQEWGVPPWLRELIPLIYINDQLAAVVGYGVSDLFYSNGAGCSLVSIKSLEN